MGQITYLLDKDKLRIGDIILSSEKTFTSSGIRLMTLGRYSHAALYVGGTTIEATLSGVFSKSIQRLPFFKENQVAVFRYKEPLSDDLLYKVCDYARSQVGSLYALPEAVSMKALRACKVKETKKQFCSRLVAKAYDNAGIYLGNLRYPAYCTPKQLGLCSVFEQVHDVLKIASEREIEFANSSDPNVAHQLQTYKWLGLTRDLIESLPNRKSSEINTINDVNELLEKYPDLDRDISNFVKTSGYLEHYLFDSKVNPHRYKTEVMKQYLLKFKDPVEFLCSELEKETELFRVYLSNLHGYYAYYKNFPLEFFSLHVCLYLNLMQTIHTRIKVIKNSLISLGEVDLARELATLETFCSNAINAYTVD
ncbi:YiiX/YebB-like N1pC/P60 family cysteine hydrolase [Pseudoalteromonas sp. S2755]|uniref:YiiX/YebB-like N1pC/P60 family cysteine hydrolase n=1 Tax=Pseudoalteromonas sp. S2755 TaxID=2066523 RepID=UPI001486226E|nr:YiiX/YebB-like N1pC/P60 family cysteine hydrolase [Pseudoalteromonas sp. S2755]